MSDDRAELAQLVRGFSALFDYAREGAGSWLTRDGVMPEFTEVTLTQEPQSPENLQIESAPLVQPTHPTSPTAKVAPAVTAAPNAVSRAPAPASTQARTVSADNAPRMLLPTETVALTSKIPSVDVTGDRRVALSILADHAASCNRCVLHAKRTQAVFHRGNPEAELFFVGEAPGADEDRIGQPFVGAAGQLLDKIIGAMGMTENDVYIANVAKCRPPSNRVPEPDEAAECGPYLVKQLEIVRPKVVVAWGKTAASFLLGRVEPMARLRGKWHKYGEIPLLVTWHPSYLLRTPAAKRETWDDMKMVLAKLSRKPAGA